MKNKLYGVLLALGALMVVAAIFVLDGIVPKAIGGVCIGIGAGLIGVSLSELIKRRMINTNPAIKRRMQIDEKDERNITINNRAKAKAFNAITPVYGVTMLIIILTNVELWVTLLLTGAFLALHVVYYIYLSKYNKEM